jgi:hypothetical protein
MLDKINKGKLKIMKNLTRYLDTMSSCVELNSEASKYDLIVAFDEE